MSDEPRVAATSAIEVPPPSPPTEDAPPNAPESGPVGRLRGVDLARCFAIMGMVLVNYRLRMGGWRGEPEWLLEAMNYVNSRAAATFVMLAGISLTLLYRSRVDREAPRRGWRGLTGTIALVALLAVSWVAVDFYAAEGAEKRSVSFGPLAGQERSWGGDEEPKKEIAPVGERFRDHLAGIRDGEVSAFLKVGAGVSAFLLLLLLILGRRANGPRGIILKRVVFLAAVGFAWYPLWTWDILHYYAVYLLAGSVLLGLRARWIMLLALAVFLGALWYSYDQSMGPGRSPFEPRDRNTWGLENMARSTFVRGIHPVLPWLCFLCVGLVVGRMRLDLWSRKIGLLVVGLALAAAGYLGNDHVHDWLKIDTEPDSKVHDESLELVLAEAPPERDRSRSNRRGNRNRSGASRGTRGGNTTANEKKKKPEPPPKPDPLALAIPDDFDRQTHADFLAGAEKLRTLLAPTPPRNRSGRGEGGRGGRGDTNEAKRTLRVDMVERDGKTRPAVVLELAYDETKPVPRNHERTVGGLKWNARNWVRNARYVRLTGDSGPPEEEENDEEESSDEDDDEEEERREVKLWPESVGLFVIERRLRARPKPVEKEEPLAAAEADPTTADASSAPAAGGADTGVADSGGTDPGGAGDPGTSDGAEVDSDEVAVGEAPTTEEPAEGERRRRGRGRRPEKKPLEGSIVHWDTHWIDTAAMGNPTTRGVVAEWFDPDGRGGRPKFVISATGVSLSVLALALMLMSFGFLQRVLRPLTTAGEVALSLYVGHVIIGFYPLRWIDKVRGEDLAFITFYVITAWIVLIALANWWRAWFKRGPLEAIMRWMTG